MNDPIENKEDVAAETAAQQDLNPPVESPPAPESASPDLPAPELRAVHADAPVDSPAPEVRAVPAGEPAAAVGIGPAAAPAPLVGPRLPPDMAGRVEPVFAASSDGERTVRTSARFGGARPLAGDVTPGGGEARERRPRRLLRRLAVAAGLVLLVGAGWVAARAVLEPGASVPLRSALAERPAVTLQPTPVTQAEPVAAPAAGRNAAAGDVQAMLAQLSERLSALEARLGSGDVAGRLERIEKDQAAQIAALTRRLDGLSPNAGHGTTEAPAAAEAQPPAEAQPQPHAAVPPPMPAARPQNLLARTEADPQPNGFAPPNASTPYAGSYNGTPYGSGYGTPGPAVLPTPQSRYSSSPGLVRGWNIREVYQGVALLEGRGGIVEAGPGDYVPGLGRVSSISRQGREWVVVTERGLIVGR